MLGLLQALTAAWNPLAVATSLQPLLWWPHGLLLCVFFLSGVLGMEARDSSVLSTPTPPAPACL